MTIPIQNLYYLLAYAYRGLPAGGVSALATVEATAQADLVAGVVAAAVRGQIRRGLARGYVSHAQDTSAPRGRIDVGETARRALRGRVHVHADAFVSDVPANRLVLATLRRLVRTDGIRGETRAALRALVPAFSGVSRIPLDARALRAVDVHGAARSYRFLVSLCALVHRSLLPTEAAGRSRFLDVTRDEAAMRMLFQQFIYEFLRREQRAFHVEWERQLRWDLVGSGDPSLLPVMRLDIVLRARDASRSVVVDTKYTSAFAESRYGSTKLKSGYLYQMAAYLRHAPQICPGDIEGVLLHPQAGRALDEAYRLGPHGLRVQTVDLAQPWPEIHRSLLRLVS